MDGKEWREKNDIDDEDFTTSTIIHNQKELDEVPNDYTGSIWIYFGTEEERAIMDRELWANFHVFWNSVIEIRKPNQVYAWRNSTVYAWNKDEVVIFENNAKVYSLED